MRGTRWLLLVAIAAIIFGVGVTYQQQKKSNEQNALAALNIADYAYVLESGKVALFGRGSELIDDEKVQRAYLG